MGYVNMHTYIHIITMLLFIKKNDTIVNNIKN